MIGIENLSKTHGSGDTAKNKMIKTLCLALTLLLTGCNNADPEVSGLNPISDMDTTFVSYTELNAAEESSGTEASSSGLDAVTDSPKGEAAISEKGNNTGSSSKAEFSEKAGNSAGEEKQIIIYSTENERVDDDFEAAPGEIYLSWELKNAIEEYSEDPSVMFAICIDVYDYNDEHIADAEAFLNNTVIDGLTYAEINEKRGEIDEEIKRLREMSDIYLNPDLTDKQSEEYADRIWELTEEDQYYYEASMDILISADIYKLQLEGDRLAELGIDVLGVTENKRNTNYITALVSAEEINIMPFSDDVGYKVWLLGNC